MSSKKLCLAVSTYIQRKTLFPRRILTYSNFLGQTSVINLLHQAPIPKNPQFPDIQDWLRSLDHDTSNKNLKNYLQKARYIRNQLLATAPDPVLLHGDLHHENIIKHGDNWVVIDSKGVTGEPAYEVAAFIRNPIPELLKSRNIADIINNRIAHFACKLKIKPERIKGWCFIQRKFALKNCCKLGFA